MQIFRRPLFALRDCERKRAIPICFRFAKICFPKKSNIILFNFLKETNRNKSNANLSSSALRFARLRAQASNQFV